MGYIGELRVGLAQKLVCEMVIGREWEPIYHVLDRVQAAKEAQRCVKRGKIWVGELVTPDTTSNDEGINLEQQIVGEQVTRL